MTTSRLWNTMRQQKLAALWAKHEEFKGTPQGQAYHVAYMRAAGYRV